MNGRYLLWFALASLTSFLVFRLVAPGLATLLTAPLVVLVQSLQASQVGAIVRFQWVSGTQSIQFNEVHFDSLCGNFVVLSGLILALPSPIRSRLRKLAIGFGLLYLVNLAHLAVMLAFGYQTATGLQGQTSLGRLGWGIITIAYHMGEQVGTMFVPFFLFLLLTLRQQPPLQTSTDPVEGPKPHK